MTDYIALYKDTVKHLRVVRNIARDHKNALAITHIQPDAMTPYERGRMTRSCIRLGDNLTKLAQDPRQIKIAFSFTAYLDGLDINPNQFSKPGINTWYRFSKFFDTQEFQSNLKIDDFPIMLTHVANMLDQPLSKVPSLVMILKLSV